MSESWLVVALHLTGWREGCAMNGARETVVEIHADDGGARVSLAAKFRQGRVKVGAVAKDPHVAAESAVRLFAAKRAKQMEAR